MKTMRVRFVVGEWLVIVAGLVLLPMWGQSQTSWLSATDGEWRDPARWTAGVPDGNRANLQRTDGSYTVWVTNGVEAPFNSLYMNNIASGANTTRLHIADGALLQTNGMINSGVNVHVHVGPGGVWEYNGQNDVANQFLDIRNGNVWTVDGGSILFTNVSDAPNNVNRGQAWIGMQSSAALYLKDGVIDFRHGPATRGRELYVGRSSSGVGVFEITGGTMYFSTPTSRGSVLQVARWTGSHGSVRLLDGEMIFEGSTRTTLGGMDDGSDHSGAYGELIIGPNATYSAFDGEGNRIGVGHGNNTSGYMYSEGTVDIGGFVIGYKSNGQMAGTATGQVVIANGAVKTKYRVDVGYGQPASGTEPTTGFGTLEIRDGFVTTHSRGITVGRGHQNGVGIGVLKVFGGVLWQEGAWQETANDLQGFNFGAIRADNTGVDTRALGRLELSGGAITNGTKFVLGANGGTGIVHQTAGLLDNTQAPVSQPVVIGYNWGASAPVAGQGYGEYHIEGGTFDTQFDVYVGGMVGFVYGSQGGNLVNQPGASGRIQADGGLFRVGRKLHVGGNGTGELSVGAAGDVKAGSTVLDTGATLEFVFGVEGVGQVVVDGELDVHANAGLTIDLRGYNLALGGRFKLVSCDSRTADFDPDNITVLGGMAVVDQSGTDIWVSIPSGTLILLR